MFIFIFVLILICAHLVILIFAFNKLQALVRGHTKKPGGECHSCRKWIQNLLGSSCEDVGGDRLGTSVDVQVSQHDSTAHVQRLFPPK